MQAEAKIFWWPNLSKKTEDKAKNCMALGKKLKYQIPKNNFGKLKTLTGPGQKIQINFSGKLNQNKLNGEHQILIAIDRFSKWPIVKVCKSSETKEVLNFLKQNFKLYGLPEKNKNGQSRSILFQRILKLLQIENIEIEYSTPRLHTGTRVVVRG